MILDVGCGYNPKGDVNTELFLKDIGHRMHDSDLKKVRINNLINCDAQYLPFKDNCFEDVICSHVIEHVKNPFLLLKELIRVSSDTINIECPHRLSDTMLKLIRKQQYGHVNYFTKKWFLNYGRKYNCYVVVKVIFRGLILLCIPHEIHVFMKKIKM